jgi:hypothetical protein
MDNLPPGSASDADVALSLEKFPPANASAQEWADYLDYMAKGEAIVEEYNVFRSNYIAENGNTRGANKAWREYVPEWEAKEEERRKAGKLQHFQSLSTEQLNKEGWELQQDDEGNKAYVKIGTNEYLEVN